MDIENLTLKQIREISSLVSASSGDAHPFQIGKNYLIRTVTMMLVGKLTFVGSQELVLQNASWVADAGRFNDALKNGLEATSSSEIEPFVNDALIGRASICDATEYSHELPKAQK